MYNEFVYILRAGDYFKIGKTTDFSKRIGQLKIQLPFKTQLFKVINTNDCTKLENYFHKAYSSVRVNGEWFKLSEHDVVMLTLYPCTVDVNDGAETYNAWNAMLELVTEVMQQRERDKVLEQFIEDEVQNALSETPDSLGDVTFAEQLAFECPYPLDMEDMEWVVSDDTEEE